MTWTTAKPFLVETPAAPSANFSKALEVGMPPQAIRDYQYGGYCYTIGPSRFVTAKINE